MKLFDKKIGNQVVNFNGRRVQFVNSVAEVDDEFGVELLKMGFSDLYEFGKQPVYETPKEIQMKTDFSEKETWYKNECSRLRNIADARKKQVEDLEAEVKLWKAEYEKEKQARLALVENLGSENDAAPEMAVVDAPIEAKNDDFGGDAAEAMDGEAGDMEDSMETSDDDLRQELLALKKDELIAFAKSNGFTEIDDFANKKKSEIIEYIVESTK